MTRPSPQAKRVLVVDDDPMVLDVVAETLRQGGFSVSTLGSAAMLQDTLSRQPVDLILLDVQLPGADGFSVARYITKHSTVPIIFLTGKADTIDKVVGLELGAEDYITKPFDRRELVARVRAVLRRSERKDFGGRWDHGVASVQDCFFDLEGHEILSRTGVRATLTEYEFRLLRHFVTRPGRVVTRDQTLELFEKKGDLPFDRSVDVLVSRLRKKLHDTDKSTIVSVRSIGYNFAEKVSWTGAVTGLGS